MFIKSSWLGFSLIAVGVLATCCAFSQETEVHNSLIDRAVKRTDTSDWHKPIPQYYAWLSNDTVFYMDDVFHPQATRLNLTTRARTPLKKLTTFFNAHDGKVNMIHLSPDRQRFLWLGTDPNDWRLYCTNLTADRPVSWKWTEGNNFLWMPDSKHWVEFVQNPRTEKFTHLLIHTLQPSKQARRITLLPTSPLARKRAPLSYSVITPKGTLLMYGGYTRHQGIPVILINEIDIQARGALRRQIRLKLPVGEEDSEMPHFSPSGDKVACDVWVPNGKVRQRELWVWESDGTKGRSLGAIQDTQGQTFEGQPYVMTLQDLQWCPDGKKLSFIYKDTLWIIPVDSPMESQQ